MRIYTSLHKNIIPFPYVQGQIAWAISEQVKFFA